ncbi:MAG: maleylacetoacetate isomerase [Brevundimonas sp.]|uniref:maleylacetoacetate isomerase n=1 Tax=Brevundimonas sp. TaxID=1871086 RepID=UPI00391DB8F8
MILHGYWRSGTSYRTRIALNLKGLAYDQAGVDLRLGVQKSDAYISMNPQGLVPALETDGSVLTQSPAILEWLEEVHPEPPLLPGDAVARAQVRAMAALVACDIHPLNNLRVLKALRESFGADQAATDAWAARWITAGFEALEALILRHGDGWCFGHAPTLADCCLIPQVYSARRFNTPLDAFPRILAIEQKAAQHPAFMAAHPDRQPDADVS